MVIFPLDPDQTIAQMWSNGARGGWMTSMWHNLAFVTQLNARTDRQQSRWRQNCSRQSRLPVS